MERKLESQRVTPAEAAARSSATRAIEKALGEGPATASPPLDPEPRDTAKAPGVTPSKAPTSGPRERWGMQFRITDLKGEPYVSASVEIDTRGTMSRDIVERGLDERQLRAVSKEIQALMPKISKDLSKMSRKNLENSKEVAQLITLTQQTAKAIVKALGLPSS
jgi:hypothetical protein